MRLKITDRFNVFTKSHGTVLSLSLFASLIDHKMFFINIYDWISHILYKENSQEIEAAITKKQQFIGVYVVFLASLLFCMSPAKPIFHLT